MERAFVPDVQMGIQFIAVGVNIVILILIPVVLYFIIKFAVRHAINESKLFKQDK